MSVPKSITQKIPSVVSLLFILLFVYAAVSKLLDFQNFQVQIGQSPLLNSFTGFISVFILFIEFLIAFFLSFKKLRIIGLYLSLALMTLFSLYIYFILNYSPFVPCSCGGVLEDLGWEAHLVFNLFFIFLACISLYISRENKTAIILRICGVILFCTIVMVFLNISSQSISHNRNNFIRSFPPFPAKLVKSENLKFNSYYFAGQHEGNIYLGNRSAPALITEMDTSLKVIRKYQIQISDTLLDFHNIKLSVNPPYFFIYDGTVPCFFKGNLKNSRAILKTTTIPGFTKAVIIDSSTAIIRTLNENGENLMARIDLESERVQYTDSTFLQKQIDGLFDTDGILQYSPDQQKFVYLYYYRNEYVVSDENLNIVKRGRTIDTNTQAKIKIEYIESTKERKFSAPPYVVNRLSTVHKHQLYVNSMLPGQYDEMKMWKEASVIDVYDILTGNYMLSFYIYDIAGEKIMDFIVTDTHLYALAGNNIVIYRLNVPLK